MSFVLKRLKAVLALDKIDELSVLKAISAILDSIPADDIFSDRLDELIRIQNDLCARIFTRIVEAEVGKVRSVHSLLSVVASPSVRRCRYAAIRDRK